MGNSSGYALMHRLLLAALFVVAIFAPSLISAPAYAQDCAAYRGTNMPSNTCTYQQAYSNSFERLSAGQRASLQSDVRSTQNFYNGIESRMLNCMRTESDKASLCKAADTPAERARVDAMLAQLEEQYRRENAAFLAAEREGVARAQQGADRLAAEQRANAAANAAANAGGGNRGGSNRAAGDGVELLGGPDEEGTVRDPVSRQQDCAEPIAAAEDQGTAWGQARAATIFDRTLRNVSADAAIRAAMCIDDLMDKINQVARAFNAITTSMNNPLIAILAAIAAELLVQVLDQFLDNVVNAVCNAADEIFNALDNRLRNALCIKGSIDGIDPFNFDIDIPAMKCDGWSVDILSGSVIGQPVEGMNVDWGDVEDAARRARGGGG